MQILAFVCGIAAVFITWLSGTGKGSGMNTIILAGIMIGSLFSALVSLVKFLADTESQLPAITYWLMGSLNSAGYGSLVLRRAADNFGNPRFVSASLADEYSAAAGGRGKVNGH